MRRRVPVALAAALVAAFLVAFPVFADSDYARVEGSMDWRLVVIFVTVGLFAFYAALELASRDRR
jgi:predicted benzoate:H+ symporter BenE